MPTTYETLLFFHILGAFLILAGAGAGTAVGIAMTRTNRVHTIATLAQLGLKAERFANVPGGILTFVFGTWLVNEAGWDFGALWISLAYLIWFVAMGLSTGVLAGFHRRVLAHARQLIAEGVEESDELAATASARTGPITGNILVILILAILYLMTVKPDIS
jgi:uncharacterized membrane protein